MKSDEQTFYLSRVVAIIHHALVFPLVLLIFFNECETGTILTNDECLMQPTAASLYLYTITLGYMTYDLILITFWIVKKQPFVKHLQIHHALVILMLAACLYVGYSVSQLVYASLA